MRSRIGLVVSSVCLLNLYFTTRRVYTSLCLFFALMLVSHRLRGLGSRWRKKMCFTKFKITSENPGTCTFLFTVRRQWRKCILMRSCHYYWLNTDIALDMVDHHCHLPHPPKNEDDYVDYSVLSCGALLHHLNLAGLEMVRRSMVSCSTLFVFCFF